MRALILSVPLLLVAARARADALPTQGTALDYGEYYELGFTGSETALVGDGGRVQLFGLHFYERGGPIAKFLVGAPILIVLALGSQSGSTDYLGSSRTDFYTTSGNYVGSSQTDYYRYTPPSAEQVAQGQAAADAVIGGLGHWAMAFDMDIYDAKLGSKASGLVAGLFPFSLMPRLGSGGPPLVIDLGLSAGHIGAPSGGGSTYTELALAVDLEIPIVRYLQIDLKQRLNALGGQRASFGLTANLGNRAYLRGAGSVEWNALSRPVGFSVEGGVRF
jgi:hypothetical protein